MEQMVLHYQIRRKNRSITPKVELEKIVNVCHLLVVLAVFNFSSVGYAVLIMNSADDPISESKAIEGMVIYHFTGSILIVGGFLADNLLIKKKIKRDS